ncbi:4-oxalomesaconate tautomerase [Piscirickettsia salmonis]|uniref:PrpF n=1 Tax=Piscirickettsia salmonis TaxID=1238 RepID=A0A1L6TFI3_PISSA|nr:4-oxalomesaconate tautomerase [Piscirickettsia salmonis]AKP72288.1 4-oxalomesaconate tautomerase [Piscirickettsia salmonis LF-89 = ATCC VR-1361]ALB24270.1 PrpF [Piscirickettsia salmonis]ALY04071.1 4-oxalomesaconate tautomerase [Piscirickettsia salmonis]AMA43624.1 4-oxalomesaconate tautomerase [Piscirickettsia salmonis]AOS36093.1 4-oxalomesaconate tautomerase [Piscirickettsia salmonis]
MKTIPCILMRGGTSKGPFFLASDLPSDPQERDQVLLKIMGSPHQAQIDGIGGGSSVSSKVAIVSPSARDGIDVDYLFCQVVVGESRVDSSLNCGNMLSGVGPFAITKGLVKAQDQETTVRIYNKNTDVVVEAKVQTPNGELSFEGEATIDGVPGHSAPIELSFLDSVGAKTGKLLPTGQAVNIIDDIEVSCIDVSVPVVMMLAASLGKSGYETKQELDQDKNLIKKMEMIRQKAALLMGMGDVSHSVTPKMALLAEPHCNGHITSRYFTPTDCHPSHAVTGAICIASACLILGSVANQVAHNIHIQDAESDIIVEHPAGTIDAVIHKEVTGKTIEIPKVSFIRTARPLFSGEVII